MYMSSHRWLYQVTKWYRTELLGYNAVNSLPHCPPPHHFSIPPWTLATAVNLDHKTYKKSTGNCNMVHKGTLRYINLMYWGVQVCDSVDDCPKGKRDEQEVICQGSPFTRYLYRVIFSMPIMCIFVSLFCKCRERNFEKANEKLLEINFFTNSTNSNILFNLIVQLLPNASV